jgi:hypothetical protein
MLALFACRTAAPALFLFLAQGSAIHQTTGKPHRGDQQLTAQANFSSEDRASVLITQNQKIAYRDTSPTRAIFFASIIQYPERDTRSFVRLELISRRKFMSRFPRRNWDHYAVL